ncbi:MAG: rod shape-determining protein RodA [Cyanobacteria bacterium]|nr:rod shape-determining protein RodA [Cyanobacteriota bacterium]
MAATSPFSRLFKSLFLKRLIAPWQNLDWILMAVTIALTALGSVAIRSVEMKSGGINWLQHAVTGAIGVAMALGIARFRYDLLLRWRWWIYGATNLSLIAVRLVGTTALGAERWISIGGFNVQPSEFAKVGLILTLAGMLHTETASTLPRLFQVLGVTLLPCALVFIQPSLGTTLVLICICLGVLYWGNAHPGWLLLLLSPLVAAILFNVYLPAWFAWVALMGYAAWCSLPWRVPSALGAVTVNLVSGGLGKAFWDVLQDYQKARITMFLNPEQDPMGGGYHLIQSRIAIGSGELWGKGLFQGTQTQLNFIPEQDTDFIFAAIGEEFGFIGSLLVLLGFWLVCLRLVRIAQGAKDNFGSLIAIGTLAIVLFQASVNIGMTIGLAPITGIPLPWLSYGRSAMLTNFLAIGLAQSVANNRQRIKF